MDRRDFFGIFRIQQAFYDNAGILKYICTSFCDESYAKPPCENGNVLLLEVLKKAAGGECNVAGKKRVCWVRNNF